MIRFNGISSDEVGVIVEHFPSVVFPERRIETFQIPGRNGDVVIDSEVYDNYDQPYDVFFDSKKYGGLEAAIPVIASWLLSGTGYQRLEDTYFPEFYRMAYVSDAHSFLSWFNEYGRGTLTFKCAPQRWYKIGEKEITVTNGGKILNPTSFKALPYIGFPYNSYYSLTITFTDSNGSRSITTDSNARLEGINIATHEGSISNGNYEDMYLGKETTITWTASSGTNPTSLSIVPHWWTI